MLYIKIINNGKGDKDIGHYNFTVYINFKMIGKSEVKNFKRKKGAKALIQQALDNWDKTKEVVNIMKILEENIDFYNKDKK